MDFANLRVFGWNGGPGDYSATYYDEVALLTEEDLERGRNLVQKAYNDRVEAAGWNSAEVKIERYENARGVRIVVDPELRRYSRTDWIEFRTQVEMIMAMIAFPEEFGVVSG